MAKKNEPSAALLNGFDDYQKTDLDKHLPVLRHFYTINRIFCIENNVPEEVYSIIARKGVLNKAQIAYCFGCIFMNEPVFKAYLKTLSKSIDTVFQILLWQQSITENEVAKLVGHEVCDIVQRYGNAVDKTLHSGMQFFAVKHLGGYGGKEEARFRFSLPKGIQETVRQYYPKPLNYTLNPVAKPAKTDYTFEAESIIFQELPKLVAYYMQDNIKFSIRGKPNAASVRKMCKSLSFKEFYSSSDTLENLRNYLLAGFLGGIDIQRLANLPLSLLPFLVKQHYATKNFSFAETLLTELKGFGYINYGFNNIGDNIRYILLNLPIGEWIDIENIKKYVEIHNIELLPLSTSELGSRIYYEVDGGDDDPRYKNYKEKYYANEDTNKLVVYPILNGTFFSFAAYGLLEIAYDSLDTDVMGNTYNSVYDGLKYIKLTELGAYVLSITKKYEIKNGPTKSNLIFSDDSLIILADGDLSVNEILLKNFTERVSGNRFRVSYDTFLKDCKTRRDLQNKINLFKQTVNIKLPANWNSFLDELTIKANAIETTENVVVLKLPETDRHLHSLIAQDSNIKALVAKAENFQIIVAKDNVAKLKARLKDYGYLLD